MNPWQSEYKSMQGNVGVGRAISYYTSIGYAVSIPLNDTQKYDLIVDNGSQLLRVQIKTTRHKSKYGIYQVEMHNTGGASGVYKPKEFDKATCDILFVLTKEGACYEIPTEQIQVKHCLALNERTDCYKVYEGFRAPTPGSVGVLTT